MIVKAMFWVGKNGGDLDFKLKNQTKRMRVDGVYHVHFVFEKVEQIERAAFAQFVRCTNCVSHLVDDGAIRIVDVRVDFVFGIRGDFFAKPIVGYFYGVSVGERIVSERWKGEFVATVLQLCF